MPLKQLKDSQRQPKTAKARLGVSWCTSQLSGKRIWWNWHMLLTGTSIKENTQDFKQDHSGPLQKNYDPHHCESLSPVIYLVQTQVPQIPNSTRRRQPFLIDHLPLAVFSTPLNFKICPSPQSCYSVLSDLPHCTPSLESLDSKRGVVLQFSYFV